MTIYLTRNKGWVWERPWPSWKLVVPCEVTQLLGTLIVVYGVAMAPTGWRVAGIVWAYTLVSFFVANAVKVGTYRLTGHLVPSHVRHPHPYRRPCVGVSDGRFNGRAGDGTACRRP